MYYKCLITAFSLLSFLNLHSQSTQSLQHSGLKAPVEIRVDRWGMAHIYAQNEADLFFAQGYYAASDRLFQFEVWRRQATGTVAEILGPREVKRDIGTRLFKFRGNMQQEMNHYHPRGQLIITSFMRGVNAYIAETEKNPDLLPVEFELLGIKPLPWTPEVVISRHQGLLGNLEDELDYARIVHLIGAEKTQQLLGFHPHKPNLDIDPSIDREGLFKPILELFKAYRRSIRFRPEDLVASVQNDEDNYRYIAAAMDEQTKRAKADHLNNIGSNNWVIAGEKTAMGYPIMANDPHRRLAVPSLRYAVHLVAPGWNVIGGGEPEIPGISIGHNEYGAWGLTVFATDAEDIYMYKLNPDNPQEYQFNGQWESMKVIKDTIQVKDHDPVYVDLLYTRHGPLTYVDEEKNIAWGVRAGWLEIGGSPYLASLRMDQAKNWEEFRTACNYSHIPGENMVWADKAGNIGWQAVGIAPIRPNWSGLIPVPGDGSYEWTGYLPIIAKPNLYNPSSGYISTANQNVTPPDYPHRDALGYEWSDPFRGNRLKEVLQSGQRQSMADMMRLQTDYLSIPARTLVPLIKDLPQKDEKLEQIRQRLLNWDYRLEKNSIAAGIYVAWEKRLIKAVYDHLVPENVREYLNYIPLRITIDALVVPDWNLGRNPMKARDEILASALQDAVLDLESKLGKDINKWQYGQVSYKHVQFKHPLSPAVKAFIREQLEVGPLPRGGNSHTLGNTSGNDNQSHGATFRIIVDTGDWERSVWMNSPGQSGIPGHAHYEDLFPYWAKDQFLPLPYSRNRVEGATERILWLKPE